MMMEILALVYFMLPAYFANLIPPLVKYIPILETPMDFGKRYRGMRVFGKNKTWRGFIAALIIGYLTFELQTHLFNTYQFFNTIAFFDYNTMGPLIGIVLAAGAMIGDAVESFFKRQANIPSGKSWFPFDQIDWTVGALIVVTPLYFVGWLESIIIIVISALIHIVVNYIGFVLKINKSKI